MALTRPHITNILDLGRYTKAQMQSFLKDRPGIDARMRPPLEEWRCAMNGRFLPDLVRDYPNTFLFRGDDTYRFQTPLEAHTPFARDLAEGFKVLAAQGLNGHDLSDLLRQSPRAIAADAKRLLQRADDDLIASVPFTPEPDLRAFFRKRAQRPRAPVIPFRPNTNPAHQ